MAEKMEKIFDRLELAGYLEKLAGRLRNGTIEADGRQWNIPDQMETKIRFKEKKGRFVTKLRWRWSTVDDYDPDARQELAQWQDSMKSIKKSLGESFKALSRAVEKGEFLDNKLLEKLLDDSQKFSDHAEPEWKQAVNEYMDHLDNLKRAFEARQLDVLQHEIRDLRNRMIACHREFK